MTAPTSKIRSAVLIALAVNAPLAAQDRLAEDLSRYQHESDPVRKARELVRLGVEQVEEAKKQLKAGQDEASLHTLEQYRDEVRESIDALNKTIADPERKPGGYKELQISLREGIRMVDDLILTLPLDKRPFFRAVRDDLAKEQDQLFDALFPRKPDRNPPKANP